MNRPPFTPSNSLLLSPPFTRITISEKAEAKSEANSEKQKSTVSVSNYLSTVCSAYIQYKNSQRRHSTAVLKTLPELCGNGKKRMRSSSVNPITSSPNCTTETPSENGSISVRCKKNGRIPSVPPPKVYRNFNGIKSRVNTVSDHTPRPSNVKIFVRPLRFENVSSKIGSLQNASHVPGGGKVKIENQKLAFREKAKPKIEAKSSIKIPESNVKIQTKKLDWKTEAKIGSLSNIHHKPAGGNVKIFDQPLKVEDVQSKIGSLALSTSPDTGINPIADNSSL